jgi:hypothetical protein
MRIVKKLNFGLSLPEKGTSFILVKESLFSLACRVSSTHPLHSLAFPMRG